MSDLLPFRGLALQSGDTRPTRWLTQHVLNRDVARLQEAVPEPWLVSNPPRRAFALIRRYVSRWATHPDPGSKFAARTRWLRWLPARLLMRLLAWRGYDGLLYPLEDGIIGHVFFQRRGDAIHAFSVAVGNDFDGRGFSVVMLLDYLEHASQFDGITRARVGTGGNNVTQRLLQRLKMHENSLGWQVNADGWVTFRPAFTNAAPASARRAA